MNTPQDHFRWQRFALLARSHGRSNLRRYLGWLTVCTVVGVAVLAVFALPAAWGEEIEFTLTVQRFLYFLGLFLFGTVFAAQHFGPMGRREHALWVLMQPASVLEKWVLSLLTVLVLFPCIYSLWFATMALPLVEFAWRWDNQVFLHQVATNPLFTGEAPQAQDYRVYVPVLRDTWAQVRVFSLLWLGYVACAGLAASGSLLFRRAPFVSTLVLGFLVAVVAVIVSMFTSALGYQGVGFFWWVDHGAAPLPWAAHAVNAWFWFGIPVLLWLSVWRALQERELT